MQMVMYNIQCLVFHNVEAMENYIIIDLMLDESKLAGVYTNMISVASIINNSMQVQQHVWKKKAAGWDFSSQVPKSTQLTRQEA